MSYQEFEDIKISNKGMIKLIKNQSGKDYIFPASKITEIQTESPASIIIRLLGIVSNIFDILVIHIGNDSFRIKRKPTEELLNRLKQAQEYSKNFAAKKYGEFK